MDTPTRTQTHSRPSTAPLASSKSTARTRTANLTLETPLLGAALLALVAGVLALPDLALLLLGIPTAIVGGVAMLATAARFLAR